MNSFFALMLSAIQQKITTAVPAIRYVDLDMGQVDDYDWQAGNLPPVSLPCVLVDFPATRYSELSEDVQEGEVSVELRLCLEAYSATNSLTPSIWKEKGLRFFELEAELYKQLNGWAPAVEGEAICQGLVRTTAVTEKREDFLRVRTIVFTTTMEDHSARVERQRVVAGLELSPELPN